MRRDLNRRGARSTVSRTYQAEDAEGRPYGTLGPYGSFSHGRQLLGPGHLPKRGPPVPLQRGLVGLQLHHGRTQRFRSMVGQFCDQSLACEIVVECELAGARAYIWEWNGSDSHTYPSESG